MLFLCSTVSFLSTNMLFIWALFIPRCSIHLPHVNRHFQFASLIQMHGQWRLLESPRSPLVHKGFRICSTVLQKPRSICGACDPLTAWYAQPRFICSSHSPFCIWKPIVEEACRQHVACTCICLQCTRATECLQELCQCVDTLDQPI